MKLVLTLIATAVFLPCMQAYVHASLPNDDVIGKWLKERLSTSQSAEDVVYNVSIYT